MSVFDRVSDPFLRSELQRLHYASKTLLVFNWLVVAIPVIVMYAIGQFVWSSWVTFGLYCLTLIFSSTIFAMSRYHACLNTTLNATHFTLALLLVLLTLIYTPISAWLGSQIPGLVNVALLIIVPAILLLIELITFSIQCSDIWKYAKGVAMGSQQWQYVGNQKFTVSSIGYPQQQQPFRPTPPHL